MTRVSRQDPPNRKAADFSPQMTQTHADKGKGNARERTAAPGGRLTNCGGAAYFDIGPASPIVPAAPPHARMGGRSAVADVRAGMRPGSPQGSASLHGAPSLVSGRLSVCISVNATS
jgi:hypothetical protein